MTTLGVLWSKLLIMVPDVQTTLIAAVVIQAAVLLWLWIRISSLEHSERMMIDAIERAIRIAQTADHRSAEHLHDSERWPHHRRTVIEGWVRKCLREELAKPKKGTQAGRQRLVDRISEALNGSSATAPGLHSNENQIARRPRKIMPRAERKHDRDGEGR